MPKKLPNAKWIRRLDAFTRKGNYSHWDVPKFLLELQDPQERMSLFFLKNPQKTMLGNIGHPISGKNLTKTYHWCITFRWDDPGQIIQQADLTNAWIFATFRNVYIQYNIHISFINLYCCISVKWMIPRCNASSSKWFATFVVANQTKTSFP